MLTKAKAKDYFYKLLKKLELEPIKIIFMSAPKSHHKEESEVRIGQFSIGEDGPYIVIWAEGMTHRVIRHEVIHYMQYLLHGAKMWSKTKTGNREDDPFELEADALEVLSDSNLKKYSKFRRMISTLQGDSDVYTTTNSSMPCSFSARATN